ncbi:hypothetical protein SAMN05216312_102557 [Cohnella sp. OV330]|uniref:immunoglobulin-like domain-containing protein n=1 Tax=Cohnella sp. OV330 TaxID=1855288 RepID=UPI0008ECB38F|nr:immunoglobulin-like domain-containing protein [Cohnella sp. OV330]SFA96604.1 hypothetical protein SAMN05216312_102557 [Cohnella sp. OV330]
MVPIGREMRRFARCYLFVAALTIVAAACKGEEEIDWSHDAALTRGAVVEANGRVLNPGPLSEFVRSVSVRQPAIVKVTMFPAEGEPSIMTADYDGQTVHLIRDQHLEGGGARMTTTCGGVEKRSGETVDTYMVTGCGGGEMELAVVPNLALASRVETADYGAELRLEPVLTGRKKNGTIDAYRIEMLNLGDRILECGSDYIIELQAYGTWVPISYKDNIGFPANLAHLQKGESNKTSFSFDMLQSSPEPGRYRVVKEATIGKTKVKLAAEFDIPAK